MRQAAGRTDPRTIITPDAFSVAPELVGLPLAPPWRRLTAMLADLLLVAILANAPAVFFALAAGLFVFWLATRVKRGRGTSSTGRRAIRTAFGCLGAFTVFAAAMAIAGTLLFDPDDALLELEGPDGEVPVSARALSEVVRLSTAEDSAERTVAAERLVERVESGEIDYAEMRSIVEQLGPELGEDAPAAIDALEAALDRHAAARVAVDPDTLPLDSLFVRYAAARAAGDTAGMARFGPPLGAGLAAERLAARAAEARRFERRSERLRDELADTERLLGEERDRGILATLYAILDDVGLSLGWAGLYFTFFLGWWKGRTPGKRLLGIRVVRLDGRPLGYWVAFERYGGYAASLFTGLEGFARILWDPNRQALEDRLAGTVVVRDSAEARERIDALGSSRTSAA